MLKFLCVALSFVAAVIPVDGNGQELKPYGVLPSERQLRWHEMEMYCLIHYTPTTFQDKEWGYGDAQPVIFNPSRFDANQIAQAAASAGFKGLISVAKHHDGFCLWPTVTTGYSVAQSPWKDGKGDMVKAFMDASHANGLKFGVYLSAWDRNDVRYGSAAYADAYRQQLEELMTGYGELFASWHDGANGGDGYYGGLKEKRTIDRTSYYDWETKTWPIVRTHQPLAMIFSDIGWDMRWVGNEKGFAPETSWSTITLKGKDGNKPMPGYMDDKNLGSGDRHGNAWIPAECDVPHRQGWFYHPEQDFLVKSPDQLFAIYLTSVGRGANLNLGLAPMPEGVLHPNDVLSLARFGEKVKKTFSVNYAQGAQISASNVRANSRKFSVENILDSDRYSYYASDDHVVNPVLEIELKRDVVFNLIRLRENIKLGQRLDSVRVDVWRHGQWRRLAGATSIGANRIIKLNTPISAQKLRLQLFAPVAPTLSDFGLYKEAVVEYELPELNDRYYKLDKAKFTITHQGGLLKAAFDENPASIVEVDALESGILFTVHNAKIKGLTYLPRQDGDKSGIILRYIVESSADGEQWAKVAEGEFSNIIANPIAQFVRLDKVVGDKFLRLRPVEVVGNKTCAVAELNLLQ